MKIYGLQKTTLLDYPGMVAATVFTGGCNFRCPFCHNSNLIAPKDSELLDEADFFSFLEKRRGILEGICITGGEPTLQKDLIPFIERIRSYKLKIKLDTNGYLPAVLKELYHRDLLDYVAMDIKSSESGYAAAAGVTALAFEAITESASVLMAGQIPYEFRTTVVKELHSRNDFLAIGQWLEGAKAYYLQGYQESADVPCKAFSAYSADEMEDFSKLLQEYIPNTQLRGINPA